MKSRYCYCPMTAPKIGHRTTILERIGRRRAIRKACKPDLTIFRKAMEVAGVSADEVIFIGDSVTSDVEPALKLGITPIYISRAKETDIEGIKVIRTLDELEF